MAKDKDMSWIDKMARQSQLLGRGTASPTEQGVAGAVEPL
jgi:hypothetical protein